MVPQLKYLLPVLFLMRILKFQLQALAVPKGRDVRDRRFIDGERLFQEAKCAVCHSPVLKMAEQFKKLPQLANQTFHAYTDLLLHDMGEGLADNRPDLQAGGRDWRTPSLWGGGLSQKVSGSQLMLHDVCARNYGEAILWYGGEANVSREFFKNMKKRQGESCILFKIYLGG